MQGILDSKEVIKKKNEILQPLYRQLKSTIRHMTHSEEYKLLREYTRNRQLILNTLPEESSKAQEGLEALKKHYSKLIENSRLRMKSNAGRRLGAMQKRLEDMFKLLDLWQQYVDVIYAPEAQIEHLLYLKKQGKMTMQGGELGGDLASDLKASENAFMSKLQQEKVDEKLATLFAKDDEAELDDEQSKLDSKMNEAYMSVKEGMTTDTAMSSEGEGHDASELKREAATPEPAQATSEPGILSSDEEHDAAVADTDAKTAQKLFNEEPIFTDDRSRETVEYQFSYDDQQLDKFKQRQEDKFDTKQRFDKRQVGGAAAEDTADVDFLSGSAQDSQFEEQNMESLNLFGVPIEQVEQKATSKEQAAKKKFVADLIDMLTELDNANEIDGLGMTQDFTSPKSLVSYDPTVQFGEEAHKDGKKEPPVTDQRALIYEDSMRLRSSIIINAYQRQLAEIDYDSLNYQE